MLHTPLLLVLLAACAPAKTPVALTFVPHWDGVPLQCGSGDIQLTDFRMYVSELQFIDSEGSVAAGGLVADQEWQNHKVAMIDLEDGEGDCRNGTVEMRSSVLATVADGHYERLGFTVGVPFELNHANPLTAMAPLDDAAMHWHWRSGYKFLRAAYSAPDGAFWMHLGSTGCEGTVQNITGCKRPNRVTVEVPVEALDDIRIGIDLARLFGKAEGSDCSSGPAESACDAPFSALGLAHTSSATGPQDVFAALP